MQLFNSIWGAVKKVGRYASTSTQTGTLGGAVKNGEDVHQPVAKQVQLQTVSVDNGILIILCVISIYYGSIFINIYIYTDIIVTSLHNDNTSNTFSFSSFTMYHLTKQ